MFANKARSRGYHDHANMMQKCKRVMWFLSFSVMWFQVIKRKATTCWVFIKPNNFSWWKAFASCALSIRVICDTTRLVFQCTESERDTKTSLLTSGDMSNPYALFSTSQITCKQDLPLKQRQGISRTKTSQFQKTLTRWRGSEEIMYHYSIYWYRCKITVFGPYG